MNQNEITALEGLIFLSGSSGITIGELITILKTDQISIEVAILDLNDKYIDANHAFKIDYTAQSYKMVTLEKQAKYYQKYAQMETNDKLAAAALETLAIVAYNQPITRFDIEDKRGVVVSHYLKLLTDRDLIKVVAKSDELGRPNLYATTTNFLNFLGINHVDELPPLSDFIYEINNLGEDGLFDDTEDFKKIKDRLLMSENIVERFETPEIDIIEDVIIKDLILHQPADEAEDET